MSTRIVFSGSQFLDVEEAPADLAKLLASPDTPQFTGQYLHLATTEGELVWVNPAAVAFLAGPPTKPETPTTGIPPQPWRVSPWRAMDR